MPPKKNPYKKIIIALILLVILVGIYFGVRFYQASKQAAARATITDPKTGKTAFQTRNASSTGDPQIDINTGEDVSIVNTASTTPNVKQRLVQLWDQPVSGLDFIYKDIEITSTSTIATPVVRIPLPPVGSSTRVLNIDEKPTPPIRPEATTTIVYKKTVIKNQEFIYLWDRKSGNIYENLASTTNLSRLSNYTLPRMEEVFFLDGTSLLARGVSNNNENINSFYINLYKETATSTLFTSEIKSNNITAKQITVLPELKKIFYFITGTGRGVTTNPDGSAQISIINTSLTEWIPQYVNKNTVAATTRPSAYFPGYLFFINTNGSGNNQYILGDKYALTTLVSPNGQKVLFSEISNNQLETSIYDVKSKTTVTLSQSTLADKCGWSPDSTLIYCGIPQQLPSAPYPDAWYQNQTKFSDNLWSINPETGEFDVVIPLQDQVSVPIDVVNIKLSKSKKYLLFQDRYSLTLWKYEL
ncbi:MAG: hypothetical protein RJB39_484 [Candidatus Parcubacteria bacterium]|jgi:hypothetical protein